VKNSWVKGIFFLTSQLGCGRRFLQILNDYKELQNALHIKAFSMPKKSSRFQPPVSAHQWGHHRHATTGGTGGQTVANDI
jgi:hypothetical protein